MHTVLVRIENNYGASVAYPANENARLFAGIAGTLTMRPADLDRIRSLGFTIAIEDRSAADVLASLGVTA